MNCMQLRMLNCIATITVLQFSGQTSENEHKWGSALNVVTTSGYGGGHHSWPITGLSHSHFGSLSEWSTFINRIRWTTVSQSIHAQTYKLALIGSELSYHFHWTHLSWSMQMANVHSKAASFALPLQQAWSISITDWFIAIGKWYPQVICDII